MPETPWDWQVQGAAVVAGVSPANSARIAADTAASRRKKHR